MSKVQEYKYEYDNLGIEIKFTVDRNVFTEDLAKATADFFLGIKKSMGTRI